MRLRRIELRAGPKKRNAPLVNLLESGHAGLLLLGSSAGDGEGRTGATGEHFGEGGEEGKSGEEVE